MQRTNVGVFVYGDIGRSPRMQNHALQLAKQYEVYFMGYLDTAPRKQIQDNPHIHLIDLQLPILGKIRKISFFLYIFVRIFLQILQILYYLCRKIPNMQFLLVQNPPSIPNLMAIWMASCIKKFKIYIDFHNYGYTILALNVKNRLILKMAERYEKFFGRKCSKAFCVSQKMRDDLFNTWGGIQATILYDRPLGKKQKIVTKESFFKKYQLQIPQQGDLLLISSTSWTKDQNFALLLDAVDLYDKDQTTSRRIRVYITGKGPEKQFYLKKIQQMQPNWTKVSINTVWLQADDYPILLSLCHLGVCLHYSSSGLDLPMKVVDMFEAGIPVLAVKYITLSQLVKDGQNGFIFTSTQHLKQLISSLSWNKDLLKKLTANVQKQRDHTWQKQWNIKFSETIKQK